MLADGQPPATYNHGLGADQVLEAKVISANGSLVTASPIHGQGLFFAIREGGLGTHGIVASTTVKAWATTNMTAQTLAFAPLASTNLSAFMCARQTYINISQS